MAEHMTTKAITFTVPGEPVGKPRMTRRDKWMERPCVLAYRSWADAARRAAPVLPDAPEAIRAIAYLAMPLGWSGRKQTRMAGQPHRVRPDVDNIAKGILDSLFANDSMIYDLHVTKFWNDGRGARVEIAIR